MQGSFSVGLWFSILAMVATSGLHTGFMGDVSLNFDVTTAPQIIGPLALVFALSVNSRGIGSNFLLMVFTPIICGLLFSWGELVIEFDPHTASKGWGILWFLFAYETSLRSALLAVVVKSVLRPLTSGFDPIIVGTRW